MVVTEGLYSCYLQDPWNYSRYIQISPDIYINNNKNKHTKSKGQLTRTLKKKKVGEAEFVGWSADLDNI